MILSDTHESTTTNNRFAPLLLLGVVVMLFQATLAGLMQRWMKWDESLSHGLIVNIVFVYLLFQSLPWQAQARPTINKLVAVILLALTSVIWFLFHLISITLLEQLSLLALLYALFNASHGLRTTLSQRLLLLLPVFSLPVWDGMTDSLVHLSSIMVGSMIRLSGLPAIIAGNSITIPAGQIIIADGCSGIRYFQISLALAFIISLMNGYKEGRMLATLAVAASIGLATNWIRIFIIVIVGYVTEMQSSLMHDHEYFGWALFAAIMLPALYFAPVTKPSASPSMTPASSARPMILLPVLALAIGPLLSLAVSLEPHPVAFVQVFTDKVQPSTSDQMPVRVTQPEGASTQNATIAATGQGVFAQVDHYERKTEKDKLVPYFARLFNNKHWVSTLETDTQGGTNTIFARITHKNEGHSVLQLQWFQVGSYVTQSVIKAKLLQIPTLIGGKDGFTIYTVQTPCEESSCSEAKKRVLENLDKLLISPPRLQ
jgi:exosortase